MFLMFGYLITINLPVHRIGSQKKAYTDISNINWWKIFIFSGIVKWKNYSTDQAVHLSALPQL